MKTWNRIGSYSKHVWSRGGLSWIQLAEELAKRSLEHELFERAAGLSFYFLIALFPLLIVLSAMVGLTLAAETGTYVTLLNYLQTIMPTSAFLLFAQALNQIAGGASGQKLSFGLLISLWTASSGMAALIQALNVAFNVPKPRPWWRRRLVAMALTLTIVLLIAAAMIFLLAGSTAGEILVAHLPLLAALTRLSTFASWLLGLSMLFVWITIVYAFGPNLKRKRWQGILPGTCLALLCWLVASLLLRLYLGTFGSLNHSYGSIAGVIALLFWLYVSAAAVLVGGEINSIIWHATK